MNSDALLPVCYHHDFGECGSCPLFSVPYPEQLSGRYENAVNTLASVIGDEIWLPPVESPVTNIRNKAKMAVTGTIENPKLGLTTGVDLTDCQVYLPTIRAAFPAIKQFITLCQLQPYDLSPSKEKVTPARARSRGELKYVMVTAAPSGELMISLVLRSTADLSRIKSKLPLFKSMLLNLKVFSVNIHPEHKATLLGDREIMLTEQVALPMQLGTVNLLLGPVSFFQTNTYIAEQLYRTAANWVSELVTIGAVPSVEEAPLSAVSKPTGELRIWDLYCGVGGFAQALRAPGREITGIELSPEAIENAKQAADSDIRFIAEDATAFALSSREPVPDFVIVNPPRRGIGPELATWINDAKPSYVLYSSCNPTTLAQDLAQLTNYQVIKAQLFDMFPNTTHSEVLTLLKYLDG